MPFDNVPLPRLHVDLPAGTARERAVDALRAWVASAPLTELARDWGGVPPSGADVVELFGWFSEFSNVWDFRAGSERNSASTIDISSTRAGLIQDAAAALGMAASSAPTRRNYDATVILGGLVRACIIRPRYAAWLRARGVHLGDVVAIGGFRPLQGDELGLAAALGVRASNEMDVLVHGVAESFGIRGSSLHQNPSAGTGNGDWQVVTFPQAPGISVVAAPSSNPHIRRANTIDSLGWWGGHYGAMRGKQVLVITTSIYVPYQGAAAMRTLGLEYGADAETVGVPADIANLSTHTQQFRGQDYLQEIRSAIRGNQELLRELSEAAG